MMTTRRAHLTIAIVSATPKIRDEVTVIPNNRSWQEVIELLDTAVLLTDAKNRVIYTNPTGSTLAHRLVKEVVGSHIIDVFAELAPIIQSVEQGNSNAGNSRSIQISFPGGITELFDVVVRRHRYDDDESGYFISLHQLPQNLHRGLFLHRSVSDLMPTFLHELKNPLAAIATSVELLLEDIDGGHVQEELKAIFGEIRRMKLVLDGVGLAGRQLRSRSYTQVQDSLKEACTVLQPLARRKRVTFETDISSLLPLPFNVAVLKAVLFNLVMNGIHACQAGDSIRVSCTVTSNIFSLVIRDTGQGMDKETLAKCTELFYTTKPSGSGIGLALCHEVAVQAQGELQIRSRQGYGTQVSFVVPIELDLVDVQASESATGK